ncbi:MAG TPA: hypothetical protein VGE86_10630 [Thermoanaerobaculia bacterium]
MPESESKKPTPPKTQKDPAHHKARVETSHTTKKMTSAKFAAPKRFSHSAIGNR